MKKQIYFLKLITRPSIIFIAAFMLASCASTTQVVLLPGPDGKVGVLEVSGTEGKDAQQLDQAWQSVQTSPLTGTPGTPQILDEKQVKEIFKHALSAQPGQPATYIMYFNRGSANVTAASMNLIPKIMESIKIRNSKNIVVIGHTDSVGPAEYNRALSLRRARAVADALIAGGLSRAEIEITYYGKGNPLVIAPEGIPEPRNRRVEIIVR